MSTNQILKTSKRLAEKQFLKTSKRLAKKQFFQDGEDENQEKTGKKPATFRKPAKDWQKTNFSQKCTNFQLFSDKNVFLLMHCAFAIKTWQFGPYFW